MPIRVEYSLTNKGKTLLPVLNTISNWAIKNSTPDIHKGMHFNDVHKDLFN